MSVLRKTQQDGTTVLPQKNKKGADVLSIAHLAHLIVLCALRLILCEIVKEEGMSYLSLPFSLYCIGYAAYPVMTMKTLHVFLSRRLKRGQMQSVQSILTKAKRICIGSGVMLCLLLAGCAYPLTQSVLFFERSFPAVICMGAVILVMCPQGIFGGCLHTLQYGGRYLRIELIRSIMLTVCCPVFVYLFYGYGTKVDALLHTNTCAFAYGALGVSLAMLLVTLVSGLLLFAAYTKTWKKEVDFSEDSSRAEGSVQNARSMSTALLFAGLFTSIVFLVDEVIFFQVMHRKSPDTDALHLFGIYYGEAMPVLLLIALLTTAFFVREGYRLSALIERGETMSARNRFRHASFFLLFDAFLSAALCAALSGTLSALLFPGANDTAKTCIMIGSLFLLCIPSVFFGSLVFLRIRKYAVLYVNAFIALIIHALLMVLLMIVKPYGLTGMLIAQIVMMAVLFVLTHLELTLMLSVKFHPWQTAGKKLLSAAIAGGIAYLLSGILSPVIGEALTLAAGIVAGGVIYLFVLLVLRGIRVTELYHLPFGGALAGVFKSLRMVK